MSRSKDNHDQNPDEADGKASRRSKLSGARSGLNTEKVPRPASKRRRSSVVSVLSGFLSFLFLVALGAGGALYFGKLAFEASGPLETERNVMIPRGQGLQGIAQTLEREGVITSPMMFMAAVVAHKAQDKLQAGEFLFPRNASMADVMDRLVTGKAVLHSLTIPEGLTAKQIVDLVNEHEILTGEIREIPLEGTLLPETYKFSRGTTRQQMIDRMRSELDKALEAVWEMREPDIPLANPRELLILASIVEKETGKADERPRVAGVFVNRLNKGMRLQSDPTILYGLYKGDAWARPRTILRSELQAPNPYNTYQIDRLPPGPIANVGRAALEAVAKPTRTDELFFVADGTGGHAFAKTLEEHNRNVAAWREIERERAEQRAAEEAEAAEQAQQDNAAGASQ